jgi:NAD(P)-dependent dehydrogenase (short-subunit alcohol dehydrogenase family)
MSTCNTACDYYFEMHTTSVPALFRMDGRTALVTGAGRGIGRACAIALAQAGAECWLGARNASELDDTASVIRIGGGHRGRNALRRVLRP